MHVTTKQLTHAFYIRRLSALLILVGTILWFYSWLSTLR